MVSEGSPSPFADERSPTNLRKDGTAHMFREISNEVEKSTAKGATEVIYDTHAKYVVTVGAFSSLHGPALTL
jgi:hypothetical protein